MGSAWLLIGLATAAVPADGLPAAPVTALAFAPDGASVVVATPHAVAEFSWPGLVLQRNLNVDLAHVHDLAFAPGGKALAIAGGKPGESGRVVLLSWPQCAAHKTIDVGSDVIYRAAWHSDAGTLALAGGDTSVRLASLGVEGAVSLEEHSGAVLAAVAVPAKERPLWVTAGRDQTIRVWDAARPAKSLRSFDNHTGSVHDLALRPAVDGGPPLIASAGADRTVRFWQPTIGRMLRFSRLSSPPLAVCWTGDGKHACAACQDGSVRVVEAQTAKIVSEHKAVEGWAYSLALAPDGQSLLVGGEDGQLKAVTLPLANDQ